MMARSTQLQSEAGYIDARSKADRSTKTSCNARPHHTFGSRAAVKMAPATDGLPSATDQAHRRPTSLRQACLRKTTLLQCADAALRLGLLLGGCFGIGRPRQATHQRVIDRLFGRRPDIHMARCKPQILEAFCLVILAASRFGEPHRPQARLSLGALRSPLPFALGHQTLDLLALFGVFRRLRLPPIGIATRAQPPGMRGRRLIMVDILTAVLIDGLPAVEAACAEALAEGVHSADEQRDPVAQVPDLFEVGFPRAGVVKRGSMPPSLALRALAQAFARGEIWLQVLDALAADDIDTDCNGVITMANLTVTMTTTRRR